MMYTLNMSICYSPFALQSPEEIQKLMVDERLSPINRAVLLLRCIYMYIYNHQACVWKGKERGRGEGEG